MKYLFVDMILPNDLLETYLDGVCPFCSHPYNQRLYHDGIICLNNLGDVCRRCNGFVTHNGSLLLIPRATGRFDVDTLVMGLLRKFTFIPLKIKEWADENDYEIPLDNTAIAHYKLVFD